MEKSVLDGCGRYSEKLIEISEAIVEQKIKNGETPSKNDIWTIDSEIFEAYQTILANAKDSNAISRSIEYLKESVEKSGNINNLNNLAVSLVRKSLVEEQKFVEEKEEHLKVFETTATVAIITDVMKDGSLNNLDNFLNTEIANDLDIEIQKAKNGDEKASAGIEAFKGAAKALGKYPQLDEKKEREVLARMMGLAAFDSTANNKLLEEMAKKYGFNILENGEDGKISVDKEKLTAIYQSKVPETSKASEYGIKEFKVIFEEKAKMQKEKSGKVLENPLEIFSEVRTESKKSKINDELRKALEISDTDAINTLSSRYHKETKVLLKEKIDAINKAQELGKKVSPKLQDDVFEISEATKKVKEQENTYKYIEINDAR